MDSKIFYFLKSVIRWFRRIFFYFSPTFNRIFMFFNKWISTISKG
nr:MAG TPA: hypothetical protein [Bacteriophage sp.]